MLERMTDICDQADQLIEMNLNKQLEEIKQRKGLQETGFCLYCSSKLDKGYFCDIDCRDDYEFVESRKRANG